MKTILLSLAALSLLCVPVSASAYPGHPGVPGCTILPWGCGGQGPHVR